ncbi:SDR family oxidoreductase [Paraburkholderia phenoliruptrix]|uniref:SDR family oxidoreductase n=1 Tax=Paraburkholderia phenoliruptrix TaxID=252970 RepID=UPI0020C67800|nr:SDR family oxidoreductase [Paraburkholderia phenoliruptrix]
MNVSSSGGSLTLKDNPSDYSRQNVGAYQASKTALNAVAQAFAIEVEGTSIKVNAVCPGFTATDLSNHAPGAGSVEDAAREPVTRMGRAEPSQMQPARFRGENSKPCTKTASWSSGRCFR